LVAKSAAAATRKFVEDRQGLDLLDMPKRDFLIRAISDPESSAQADKLCALSRTSEALQLLGV
jgi:hypothetical protein